MDTPSAPPLYQSAPVPVASPAPISSGPNKGGRAWLWLLVIGVALVAAYSVYAFSISAWPFTAPEQGGVFVEPKYGISLIFPPTWNGMVATSQVRTSRDTICFSVPHETDQGFCLLQLSIYTPAQWKDFKEKYEIEDAPLAQNERYVISAEYSIEAGGEQYSDFQIARSAEIPGILRSFEFTK